MITWGRGVEKGSIDGKCKAWIWWGCIGDGAVVGMLSCKGFWWGWP